MPQSGPHADEHFPGQPSTVEYDDAAGRWALLIEEQGSQHRFTSPTLTGLLTKSQNLLEYEDEADEWEMKQMHKP